MTNVTMSEELATLRDRVPGCSIVAFADLSTGMVLASSTAEKTTQERLDALCANGREALLGAVAQSLAAEFGAGSDSRLHVAIRAGGGSLACFVLAPQPAQEALCCVVSTYAPLDTLIAAATALLERTTTEG